MKQALGGIVTPAASGGTEYYTCVTQASANRVGAVSQSITAAFDVWYDLPSLRREALVSVNLVFVDNDGRGFRKTYDVRVAP